MRACSSVGFIYLCPPLALILPMITENWDLAVNAAPSHTINFPLKLTYAKYIFYPLTHTTDTAEPTHHLGVTGNFPITFNQPKGPGPKASAASIH